MTKTFDLNSIEDSLARDVARDILALSKSDLDEQAKKLLVKDWFDKIGEERKNTVIKFLSA